MSSQSDARREAPVVTDALPEQAATSLPESAEVAPGVVLDPETRQPMAVEVGADAPPTAPPEMLGLSGDEAPGMEQPDDLQGPPS